MIEEEMIDIVVTTGIRIENIVRTDIGMIDLQESLDQEMIEDEGEEERLIIMGETTKNLQKTEFAKDLKW